ncbi:hypothetical protein J0X19_23985 [Hymenobacter sp. BT186]|uniref:T9SS type A sorting domain-containing protein n=2 Tax=Hymenobacter telluris TaxID=2816474 RepID=A0A939F1F8_9BACT|nr:hypothetical protein [Hymenobacter telluris]MBW3377069.1 hypothetical protein [Hymenobacter norwichensis]
MLCTLLVQAQPPVRTITRYTSIASGNWDDAATWRATDQNGRVIANSTPAPNGNNIITINHAVNLTINYDVGGNDGFLTIGANGSLTDNGQRILKIGDQRGSQQDRLLVEYRATGYSIDLFKMEYYKAEGRINGRVRTRSCSTFGNNSDLIITGTLEILGNLMITQGNSSINFYGGTTGRLYVYGIIDGPRGILNRFSFASEIVVGNPFDCSANAPLPVELSSFTAAFGSNQVNLRWTTASEKNSADFTVERSFDGETFSAVAKVAAAGTSSSRREYVATDRGMRKGLNYYRLKQTDLDGTFSYSQIIPVQVGSVEQQLEAYGDNGSLTIVLQTAGALQTLRVLDNMGRVVYTENPASLTTGLVTRRIQVAGASSRQMYIVQAITSEGVMNGKFMIAQ